jgi:hypothetical protein
MLELDGALHVYVHRFIFFLFLCRKSVDRHHKGWPIRIINFRIPLDLSILIRPTSNGKGISTAVPLGTKPAGKSIEFFG